MDTIIEGCFVNANKPLLYGQIVIDLSSGLIKKVIEDTQSFLSNVDYRFEKDEIIFPGMGDIHIHAREDHTKQHNHKETYSTVLAAALNGGVVHISAMPNTPVPLINEKEWKWHREKIEELQHPLTLLNYVGIGPGTRPIKEIPCFYKAYTGPSVGPLFFKNAQEIDEALSHYRMENISFHVEDYEVLTKFRNEENHSKRRPPECVETALEYLLPLIEKHEINAKLCHWSIGNRSFELIEQHRIRMERKNLGFNTTIEVSPLHLLFDTEQLIKKPELWPYVQMNPALQSPTDRLQLIEGLRNGFIDYLATDHAPHTLEEKFFRFEEFREKHPKLSREEIYRYMLENDPENCKKICLKDSISGAPWLDTFAGIVGILLKEHAFSPGDIARVTAKNPGEFVNPYLDSSYGKGFGSIAQGYQGSLTILNLRQYERVTRENLKTQCGWSPLEGWKLPAKLKGVFCRGQFLGPYT